MRQSPSDQARGRASDVGRLGQLLRRLGLAGPIEYAFQLFHGLCHPHLLRSGATAEERRMALVGDEVVPDATWVHTRAHTVQAPPERIWPWLGSSAPTVAAGQAGTPSRGHMTPLPASILAIASPRGMFSWKSLVLSRPHAGMSSPQRRARTLSCIAAERLELASPSLALLGGTGPTSVGRS